MKIYDTPIKDLKRVETTRGADHRGSFARLFCQKELESCLAGRQIVQINQSCTASVGAVRGMHFQKAPHAEMKLVRCLKGRVWDVAVDLRQGSDTFLNWHAVELTPDNADMFLIPEGFAHGFQVLEANSELLYLHTAFYNVTAEGGLRHDDPRLGIDWPKPVVDLSERDLNHPLITHEFVGLVI